MKTVDNGTKEWLQGAKKIHQPLAQNAMKKSAKVWHIRVTWLKRVDLDWPAHLRMRRTHDLKKGAG